MRNSRGTRVLVAMSGGVDSAVAALRLLDAGYDVVGCTLHLWDYDESGDRAHSRCCAPEDQYDARRMADHFHFPHFSFDRRDLFRETVVEPFVAAYLAGTTPSPCTSCNKHVKLKELFSIADKLGAEFLATGHYARVIDDDGEKRIARGKDPQKDQSYFLYATPKEQIARLLFPLGESTKKEVRAEAVAREIPGATKGESQELCFVGTGPNAYESFVEERAKEHARNSPASGITKHVVRPGRIIDSRGNDVGAHEGVHRFTVGQRKGLGVALGKPQFVSRIDASTGTVTLGDADDLLASHAELDELHLAARVSLPLDARVRVRYRHEGAPGRLSQAADATRARLAFDAPVRAVTPGQICVFYKDELVLGGGRIVHAEASAA